jgi:hypothetical protein
MNVTTTFEPLPQSWQGLTKKDIESAADAAVTNLLENGGALEMAERISALEAFLKAVKGDERFTSYVREELAKNGGKLTTASGAKIEAMGAGVSYDYSQNGIWVELDRQEKEIAAKRKALEEKLKTIPAGKMMVDEEDGEVWVGPSKSSKSTYRVSLKK